MERHAQEWNSEGWADCGKAIVPLPPHQLCLKLSSQPELLKTLLEGKSHFLKKFTALDLSSCNIKSEVLQELISYLQTHKVSLTMLDLSDNFIDDFGVDALSGALQIGKFKLKILELRNNKVTDRGCRVLANLLDWTDCGLESLGLYGNPITEIGVQHLSQAIVSIDCKLKRLNLGSTGMFFPIIPQLLQGSLQTLSLCCNFNECLEPLLPCDFESFHWLCNPHCFITRLELSNNILEIKSVDILAHVITSPICQINYLDLEGTILQTTAFFGLVEALRNPVCKVRFLVLSRNVLGDEEIRNLADALTDENCNVSGLVLCKNAFGDAGLMALAQAIQDPNCKLIQLDIRDNSYTKMGLNILLLHAKESRPHGQQGGLNIVYDIDMEDMGFGPLRKTIEEPHEFPEMPKKPQTTCKENGHQSSRKGQKVTSCMPINDEGDGIDAKDLETHIPIKKRSFFWRIRLSLLRVFSKKR